MDETNGKLEQLEAELKNLQMEMDGYQQRVNALQAAIKELQHKEPESETPQPVPENHQPTYMPGISYSFEHFIGLRFIHIAGILVLVMGIAIGVRYAINRQLISEQARILLAALAGLILYVLSVRLKSRYQLFSAILFSGAMASLYFTGYAAYAFYALIPFALAFLFMLALTVFTAYTALQYDRQEIAVLGMIGAYAIPYLVHAGEADMFRFFSYLMLINLGIIFLSFRKKWTFMSRLAMQITWLIFLAWHFMDVAEERMGYGLFFMGLIYCFFLADALSYRITRKEPLNSSRIFQLMLNNAALFVALFVVADKNIGSESTTSLTAIYLFFSAIIMVASAILLPEEKVLLRILFIQLILVLLLFIGLQWENLTVTLLWLAVASGMFILGMYRRESWLRMFALIVVGLTFGKLVLLDSLLFTPGEKVIAYVLIGILLLVISFFYQRQRHSQKNGD